MRRVAAGGADEATQEAAPQFVLARAPNCGAPEVGRTHIEAGDSGASCSSGCVCRPTLVRCFRPSEQSRRLRC